MNKMIPFLLLLVAACDKGDADKKAAGTAAAAAPSAPDVQPVLDAWKGAGLTVTAFTTADGAPYAGGACQAGQVNGVDAVVCEYGTADAAKAAEDKGRAAIGLTTGAAISHDKLLLVIADRRKADPEGRTINQATQVFLGKK